MVEVFVLLIACSLMAYFISYYSSYNKYIKVNDGVYEYQKSSIISRLIFVVLVITLVCFSGLRTFMNDTETYLIRFKDVADSLGGILQIDWALGKNPLFQIYQIILRIFVSKSGSVFIFITAILVVCSNLMFIKKYTINFAYSTYMYLAFTIYAFSMAAIKQTLAISIAIWAIPLLLDGKKLMGIILILLAMLIHPYVVVYFLIYLLTEDIWNYKIIMIIISTLIVSALLSEFMTRIIEITAAIGDEYSIEMLTGQGISVFRALAYMVVPVLSLLYRRNIREFGNKFIYLSINLATISSCFVIFAMFGGANLFGRMANYFDLFQCLALPIIFRYGIRDRKLRILLKLLGIVCFALFYYTYYAKYVGRGDCFYNHITFWELIRNW